MRYEPTWDSVSEHPLPEWYDDAKLGIFLHWGLYSVPGWAPQVPDIQQMLHDDGPRAMFANNPYAEWYRNSHRIEGSPTWLHHREVWGEDFDYDGFVPLFDEGTADCDTDAIAGICRDAGARYVVLTTKHHEGFTLWPASEPHPVKGHYHAARDLVGDLSASVRASGMRMGLYYSGGYDWPYNDALLKNPADSFLAVPHTGDYVQYATGHVRELISRYRPSVLWNDICWPAGGDLPALFAEYYNTVPDGVINDRWVELTRGLGSSHDPGDAADRQLGADQRSAASSHLGIGARFSSRRTPPGRRSRSRGRGGRAAIPVGAVLALCGVALIVVGSGRQPPANVFGVALYAGPGQRRPRPFSGPVSVDRRGEGFARAGRVRLWSDHPPASARSPVHLRCAVTNGGPVPSVMQWTAQVGSPGTRTDPARP